jgi:hypothetical protein
MKFKRFAQHRLNAGIDKKALVIFRSAIAGKELLKKNLAEKCGVPRPFFSECLHGDRPMPPEVRARLIAELGLEDVFALIDAQDSGEGTPE